MSYFNEAAKKWDDDPKKVDRARLVAGQIRSILDKKRSVHACEFGCGTGLLSWFLKDEFEKISLIDESSGMLEVLVERIKDHQLDHFHPFLLDLEKEAEKIPDNQFDVIYTLLSIHHVSLIDDLIKTFHRVLKKGGQLIVVDLEKEDGSFHAHVGNYDKHHGVDSKWLKELATKIGFKNPEQIISFVIEKKVNDIDRKYPVFMQSYIK